MDLACILMIEAMAWRNPTGVRKSHLTVFSVNYWYFQSADCP